MRADNDEDSLIELLASMKRGAGEEERRQAFEAAFRGAPRFDRYLVRGVLGVGETTAVLHASDPELDRDVALRVVRHGSWGSWSYRNILSEAQALASISHPNVVAIHNVGTASQHTFVVMELVRGRSLHAWLRRSPRPSWKECVGVMVKAGRGLAAAHACGVVHRDFKPRNVVIKDNGAVQVIDFRLARKIEDAQDEPVHRLDDPSAGTPAYMPLAQLRGKPADVWSDQFAFCVSLYEVLYGERPFDDDSVDSLLQSMGSGRIKPEPLKAEVPVSVREILLRGLASEPRQRWPSMNALLEALYPMDPWNRVMRWVRR